MDRTVESAAMSDHMLNGLAIGDYLSFGEMQWLAPLGKVNLFVGPNNAGKSNVLRFLHENFVPLLRSLSDQKEWKRAESRPHTGRGQATAARCGVPITPESLNELLQPSHRVEQEVADAIYENLIRDGKLWLDHAWPDEQTVKDACGWGNDSGWRRIWARVTQQNGGGFERHWVPETLGFLRKKLAPRVPPVFEIPIDRRAGNEETEIDKASATTVLGGRDVIRALASMQVPGHESFEEDRKRFLKIQDFVRVVTDDPEAKLSVPYTQKEVLVSLRGHPFRPLASLGSGIEQVVLHAVAATSAEDAIVTFEEPELHLHPVLQRQLLAYLTGQTSNQYFIATHSAHLIDTNQTHTFHVRLIEGESVIERSTSDDDHHRICIELGYRASDIVQANCVVWVEGPSDRVYIRHWIGQHDPHLVEDVHYSIMFYGGKLLSRLSAGVTDVEDENLDDLIRLRMLNRHVVVIMDSDLTSSGGQIRSTKQRVVQEIAEQGGIAWVTGGREIENYVPPSTLKAAVEAVAPGRGEAVRSGRYVKALPSRVPHSKQTVDKLAVAHHAVKGRCGLGRWDLAERIEELCHFIRKSNQLRDATTSAEGPVVHRTATRN